MRIVFFYSLEFFSLLMYNFFSIIIFSKLNMPHLVLVYSDCKHFKCVLRSKFYFILQLEIWFFWLFFFDIITSVWYCSLLWISCFKKHYQHSPSPWSTYLSTPLMKANDILWRLKEFIKRVDTLSIVITVIIAVFSFVSSINKHDSEDSRERERLYL